VGTLIDEAAVELVAIGEALRRHALGRLHGLGGFFGKGEIHGPILAAEKSGGGEGFEFFFLSDALETLADVDERRHHRIVRTQHPRHPRAEVRAGDRLRRHVAGVPVILMPRMQDAAEIGLHRRADEGAAIHDLRDVFHALTNVYSIHRSRDRGEGRKDRIDSHADLEGLIAFRIEGLRCGHAPGEPEQDAGVGLRLGMVQVIAPDQLRFTAHPGGRAGCGEFFQKVPSDDGIGSGGVEGCVHGQI